MKAHLCHSRLQCLEVCSVAGQPPHRAPLRLVLEQGLLEGQERVRGGREAELSIAPHGLPLLQDVERHAPCVHALPLQALAVAEDEAEARHTLQVLVGGGDDVVDVGRLQVYGIRPEARHGVHNEGDILVKVTDGPADGLDRVEGARGGLVVDDPNVGVPAALIVSQAANDVLDGWGGRLVVVEQLMVDPAEPADLGHAEAVGAVGDHEEAAAQGRRRHHAANNALHNERATALLQDALEASLP
mmetsp:Transcript_108739/g.318135  ORF Transcript_108739/g.318135 Transcript_108739/m.318135 type:complete len:244 (+) Transcript_108739:442-1173(+)